MINETTRGTVIKGLPAAWQKKAYELKKISTRNCCKVNGDVGSSGRKKQKNKKGQHHH